MHISERIPDFLSKFQFLLEVISLLSFVIEFVKELGVGVVIYLFLSFVESSQREI